MYGVQLSTMTTKERARERLSREAVTGRALAVADEEGLEALTIRRLATDLGVTPMALYWHFQDKERLLDGVAERVLSEVTLPADDPAVPWEVRLRALLDALLDSLQAHPAAVEVIKTRIMLSEPGQELTERALSLLRSAGFSSERSAQLAHYMLTFMVGLVSGLPGFAVGADDEVHEQHLRMKRATLQALPPKRFPHVIESAGPLTDCGDAAAWFSRGLDMLLAGVVAMQPTRPPAAPSR